jgi:hypothetical protein
MIRRLEELMAEGTAVNDLRISIKFIHLVRGEMRRQREQCQRGMT